MSSIVTRQLVTFSRIAIFDTNRYTRVYILYFLFRTILLMIRDTERVLFVSRKHDKRQVIKTTNRDF